MLEFEYFCQKCGKRSRDDDDSMVCGCGGYLRANSVPGLVGSRDNFGIKNEFVTPEGKKVDNWKSWEKSGYRNPLDTVKDKNVREGIKSKIDKIKHQKRKG